MTPLEAVKLTGYLQAYFPQQPINEYTPDALGELLAPYTLDDCKAAVQALAMRVQGSEGNRWCAPTDIYAEVRRARARRIDDEVFSPPAELNPDDTAAYVRWLDSERRAVGDGAAPTQPPTLGARNVVRELESRGLRVNSVPTERVRPYAEQAREAARASRADRLATTKPDPEPLLTDAERSREPEPTTETEETTDA